MSLRGAQIQRDGPGTCGLLPHPTLSSNQAEWPASGVYANTWMSLCVSTVSHRHFTPGGTARDRL